MISYGSADGERGEGAGAFAEFVGAVGGDVVEAIDDAGGGPGDGDGGDAGGGADADVLAQRIAAEAGAEAYGAVDVADGRRGEG